MQTATNPTTGASRRYFIEFAIAMTAYVVVIALSRNLLEHSARHIARPWQIALAISPLIPVILLLIACVRFVLATDELQRHIIIESIALAGAATALLSITYGLIENDAAGFPKLSAWWTWCTFGTAWLLAQPLVRRRYR